MDSDFRTECLKELNDPERRDRVAAAIVERYVEQLRALVRRQLSDRLRARIDEEDVLQSVWGSFFRRSFQIPDRDSLFALLCDISLKKARSAARRHTAEKRSVARETQMAEIREVPPKRTSRARYRQSPGPEDDLTATHEADSLVSQGSLQLMLLGATPEQAASIIEAFDGLDEPLQQILMWRLENLTEKDIAARLGVTRRTVTRRLALIRSYLRSL